MGHGPMHHQSSLHLGDQGIGLRCEAKANQRPPMLVVQHDIRGSIQPDAVDVHWMGPFKVRPRRDSLLVEKTQGCGSSEGAQLTQGRGPFTLELERPFAVRTVGEVKMGHQSALKLFIGPGFSVVQGFQLFDQGRTSRTNLRPVGKPCW